MLATVANMKALLARHNQPITVPGIVAWSECTGEERSASPGDYWMMDDHECLEDSLGNPMMLVKRTTRFIPIS